MLNQLSTEAINSAAYVENYLDCVENFPDELQRLISRLRELDVYYQAHVNKLHYWKRQSEEFPKQKQKCYLKMQQALSAAQEIGDEKMAVSQALNDKIELRYRSLDHDFRNIDAGKEDQVPNETRDVQVPVTPNSTGGAPVPIMERPNKRSRRGGRSDNFSISESNQTEPTTPDVPARNQTSASNSSQKKTSTGKKKKRKSRQTTQVQREDNSPKEEEPVIDPDEPTYCLCDQISFGEMIMCDNDLCPIEWFHFACVSLTTKPKGKWYCPKCRGDRPNVMKPKAQFLRELEKYNKEKEEKT